MFNSSKYVLKLNIISISLFLSPLLALSQPAIDQSASPKLPFLAEIIDDKINVRAGQSTGFEKLCQMDKGEEIIVFEQNFSWYKIRLPKRCPAYISEKYVERIGLDKGKIIGSHVNIRATASAESSALGMIAKDEEVRILGKKDGWYKIEPNEHCFGWVAGQFAAFKSNDVSLYHEPQFDLMEVTATQSEEFKSTDDAGIPQNVMDVSGILAKSDLLNAEGVTYQVMMDGQAKYYLKTAFSLDKFIGSQVNIKGVKVESSANPSMLILDLYQIRLIY